MHSDSTPPDRILPALTAGLTRLHRPSMRSLALHQLVVDHLDTTAGNVLWVDARNNASTFALHDVAPSPRALSGIQIARGFTAYQHHSLITKLPIAANERTHLIVAPCVASLYADDDVPSQEAEELFASTLTILRELATSYDLPILITAADTTPALAALVEEYVDQEIDCQETDLGLQFTTPDFQTELYWDAGYWQTTIPYWVDLLGAVETQLSPHAAPTPAALLEAGV